MREKCNVNHQLSNESNNEDKYFSKEINTFLCDSDTTLWTPIVNNKINNGIGIRQKNATIESWFKTIKVDIFDEDHRMSADNQLYKNTLIITLLLLVLLHLQRRRQQQQL
ncbi:hypothetical protein QTP88_020271 [Uroleucon formosanum]